MALKIMYQICCGIDVHKTFVVACIAATNSKGVTTYKSHRFSTCTKGLKELLQWLIESNCKDVCMESTGKYWIPVYNVLEKDCSIYKIVSRFPIFNWETLFRTLLEKALKRFWIRFLKILLILPLILNL